MFVFLQHKHPRTFGQDKSITIFGKWPRGALRFVIPRLRQRADHRVALDNSFGYRRIHSPGNKYRLHARLNVLIRITDRVSRRSAARGHHMTVAAETKLHADLAGNRPHGAAGDAKNADLLFFPAVPQAIHLFGEFLRAAAGAQNYSDFALLVDRH